MQYLRWRKSTLLLAPDMENAPSHHPSFKTYMLGTPRAVCFSLQTSRYTFAVMLPARSAYLLSAIMWSAEILIITFYTTCWPTTLHWWYLADWVWWAHLSAHLWHSLGFLMISWLGGKDSNLIYRCFHTICCPQPKVNSCNIKAHSPVAQKNSNGWKFYQQNFKQYIWLSTLDSEMAKIIDHWFLSSC